MSIFELSDEQGNKAYIKGYSLAFTIAKEKDNPFVNMAKVVDEKKISKEHIITAYDEFCEYFY